MLPYATDFPSNEKYDFGKKKSFGGVWAAPELQIFAANVMELLNAIHSFVQNTCTG